MIHVFLWADYDLFNSQPIFSISLILISTFSTPLQIVTLKLFTFDCFCYFKCIKADKFFDTKFKNSEFLFCKKKKKKPVRDGTVLMVFLNLA